MVFFQELEWTWKQAAATKIDDGDTEMDIKPSVGTVVKVEGSKGDAEGDPFALISAVELLVSSTKVEKGWKK